MSQIRRLNANLARGQAGFLLDPFRFGGPSEPSDPYWDNVSLLMRMDAEPWVDISSYGLTATEVGTVLVSSTAKFDNSANFGSNSGNLRLAFGSFPTQFNLTGVDGTIEGWMRMTAASAYGVLISARQDYSGRRGYWVRLENSGAGHRIYLNVADATGNSDYYSTVVTGLVNTWAHIAVCKSGNYWTGFINGIKVLDVPAARTLFMPTTSDSTYGVRIGGTNTFDTNGSNAYIGLLDEVRVTKGVVRYTADFTPPTERFPGA